MAIDLREKSELAISDGLGLRWDCGVQLSTLEQVKREKGIMSQNAGWVTAPERAGENVAADRVSIDREALSDLKWPAHAALALEANPNWARWSTPYEGWSARRAKALAARVGIIERKCGRQSLRAVAFFLATFTD